VLDDRPNKKRQDQTTPKVNFEGIKSRSFCDHAPSSDTLHCGKKYAGDDGFDNGLPPAVVACSSFGRSPFFYHSRRLRFH